MEEQFDIRQNANYITDKEYEVKLRPLAFHDFSGQPRIIDNLSVFVKAAKLRGDA
jgi:Holliday junction DNA helicase RuvB